MTGLYNTLTFCGLSTVMATLALQATPARATEPKADDAKSTAAPVPKDYEISVALPDALPVGTATDLRITIKPKAPYVLKVQTPFEVTLKPSVGLVAAKTKLTAKDFLDPKSEAKSINACVTAGQAGPQTLAAEFMFFLCTKEMCARRTDKLELQLPAK